MPYLMLHKLPHALTQRDKLSIYQIITNLSTSPFTQKKQIWENRGMQQIASLFTQIERQASKVRCERDELIQTFTNRLNAARQGTKWKPLTYRAIAVKLAHLSVSDLYAFQKQCEQAKSFSAYFFWALKPKQ